MSAPVQSSDSKAIQTTSDLLAALIPDADQAERKVTEKLLGPIEDAIETVKGMTILAFLKEIGASPLRYGFLSRFLKSREIKRPERKRNREKMDSGEQELVTTHGSSKIVAANPTEELQWPADQDYPAKRARKSKSKPGFCEICMKEHDGTYGTGRYCSRECRYHKTSNSKSKNQPGWCEICARWHDGSYGTGRYCGRDCRYKASRVGTKEFVANDESSSSSVGGSVAFTPRNKGAEKFTKCTVCGELTMAARFCSPKCRLSFVGNKDNRWKCSACTLINNAESLACAACETPKSTFKPGSTNSAQSKAESKLPVCIVETGPKEKSTTAGENISCELDETDDEEESRKKQQLSFTNGKKSACTA
uniref:RanBP2-type domain-containing protein n=1 Tax=Lotharella oceanica TaxID=641309 RepID=A0A7S2TNB3_9EUKA